MGLTTALFTGLSGMTVNSQAITVTGNNIANVNTTGFKSSRISFETQVSQRISSGSAPRGQLGGTNPSQIGLGTRISQIARNFTTGSINPTGVNTDMAIEGGGFFILNLDGVTRYTRDGSFLLDANSNLVSANGGLLQGYGVDDDFNLVEGLLTNINVPLGALTIAEATTTVQFTGNLNTSGEMATRGSILRSVALTDSSTNAAATGTSALADLEDPDGNTLFNTGDVITVRGARKGGASLPDHTFEVGAANTTESDANGTTLADFLAFLDNIFGLDSDADAGVGIDVNGAGEIVVTGNSGTANALELEAGHIIVNAGTGSPSLPFTWTVDQQANGESVRTTFVAFDSLGTPMSIDLTMVLEDKSPTGSTWRYYVQSEDDDGLDRVLGTGLLNFDNNGQIAIDVPPTFLIERANGGAGSPQTITLALEGSQGSVSALADSSSRITATNQDGSAIGTLEDFTVTEDGQVVGIFSNSLLRTLGQITLAMFSNPQGLIETGGNVYNVTINSGTPQIVTAGSGGAGRVVSGALELSNVELSQEFINLIAASTGFSAASRVVTTSDRLIQELLAASR